MPTSMAADKQKSIRDILLAQRVVAQADIDRAEMDAKKSRKMVHQSLVDLGLADKMAVLQALAKAWKVKPVNLDDVEISWDVAKLIPDSFARAHSMIPFIKEDSNIFVAMVDPQAAFLLEDLRLKTGCDIRVFVGMPADIEKTLDKVYGTELHEGESQPQTEEQMDVAADEKTREIMESLKEMDDVEQMEQKTDLLEVDASAPEVERIVNALILAAIQNRASDIHIEPFEDPAGKKSRVIVRLRVDGFLKDAPFKIPWTYRNAVLAKIKIMTQSMNLTERRIPQSGRIQVMAKGRPIEFRVETIPTVFGESASMRLLDRKNVKVDVHSLGFLPDTLDRLLNELKGVGGKKNYGMVLVTGPTGSGKTTTLYACLNHINNPNIRIITAENPVEYNIDGIVQVQVNPDLSLGHNRVFNFATALRSFLRLDPDVIMVGEIRDKETAQIAVEAAMTGHLVLSTLHTNDSASAVSRLAEMGIPSYIVTSTLKLVVAQRLCRVICPACKKAVPPSPDQLEVFRINGFTLPENTMVYAGEGCKACGGTGFKGRLGMYELLLMDQTVRSAALTDLSADNIRDAAIYHSPQQMRTMVQDGLVKVLQGSITLSEVLGVTTEKASSGDGAGT